MTPALYINSAGLVEAVEPSRQGEVESLGWVPASTEQARDYFLREQYGTAGQAAIAGVESFGSMLTLGLSTWTETALGVDPEAIRAREEFNPLASGVGSTVGILAPLLLTGGASGAAQGAGAGATSAAARAASMAGPSLLARAGKSVAKAALRELPADASLAQRLAAKGLAAAAGGAVEGAGYEVGQLVHESALGDPGLTAEAALARVGLSAATFGALSGAGGVLGTLAKEAGAKLGGSSSVRETLSGWLDDLEARSAGKAAGGIQHNIKRLRSQLGDVGAKSVLKDMGEMGLVDWYTTPSMTYERASSLMQRSGATMGELLKSADELAAAEGVALADLRAIIQRARSEILAKLEKNPYQREAAGKLDTLLTDIKKQGKQISLEDLHGLRMQNDEALYGMRGTMDPYATAYRQALHDLRGIYSEGIEAGIQKIKMPLDEWRLANRQYHVGARALEFAETGIERSVGNNIFGLSSALWGGVGGTLAGGPIGGLVGTVGTELLRRHGSGMTWRAARILKGLLEGEEGALVANRTAEAIAAERWAAFGEAQSQRLGAAFGSPAAPAPSPAGQLSPSSWWSRAVAPNVSGRATRSVLAQATAAPETAAALVVLAKAQKAMTEEIDSALKSLISNAPSAIGRTGAAALSRRAADAVDARRLAASPELLEEALARQTDELHHHAPGIAQALQLAAAQKVALLAAKAPQARLPGLHARKVKPSAHDLAKFARFAEVVENPLRALTHARQGTLTPDHVAGFRLGSPALYQHVQERFLHALMGHGGKTIRPQSRMMASMLTGFQLDGAMGWNAIAANQAVYAGATQTSGMDQLAQPNPNAGALKQAGRAQTAAQRLDSRMEGR